MTWNVAANPQNYDPGDEAEGDQVQSAFGLAGAEPRNYDPGDEAEGGQVQSAVGADAEPLNQEVFGENLVWWEAPDFDPPVLQNQNPWLKP